MSTAKADISNMERGELLALIRSGGGDPDKHLTEDQKEMRDKLVEMGHDPHEAKLRALTIGGPRDIDRRVPYRHQEFPKMVYHASGMTKIVQDANEQAELGEAWGTTPVVAPTDWKAKLNEVFTASGYQVRDHHLEFLQFHKVANVTTLAEAGAFLDKLDEAQQEQFFTEAEDHVAPEAKVMESAAKPGKKAAAAKS